MDDKKEVAVENTDLQGHFVFNGLPDGEHIDFESNSSNNAHAPTNNADASANNTYASTDNADASANNTYASTDNADTSPDNAHTSTADTNSVRVRNAKQVWYAEHH